MTPAGRPLALALLLGLGGCSTAAGGPLQAFFDRLFHHEPPPPPPAPHYVVGGGYEAEGTWYYPREDFSYDMSGIAAVITGPHDKLTTDGELYDPTAMAAAHQTLQLPAVLRVTNLENGRQALLRLNDRGPADPGRILAVTPRVAQLLGFDADGTARVRLQIESGPSQSLAGELHGATLAIAAAPIGAVQSESLAPPAGARGRSGGVTPSGPGAPAAEPAAPAVPARLPEQILQGSPAPGELWIEAGRFSRIDYARSRAARLAGVGASVGRLSRPGQTVYTVRIGPLGTVAQADSTLRQVIQAGVPDARIEVE